MPQPMDARDFAGPHPTCRELVARLAAWGFTRRKEEGMHTLYPGPHGGTLRVIRSELGPADPVTAEKAARLAGVTPAEFWGGPTAPTAAPLQEVPRPAAARPRRRAAGRDSVLSVVLTVHVTADRPLGFDQVVALSGRQVTRAQASAASSALCRDGQLDRRAGVYQWSEGQRAAARQVPLPRRDTPRAPEPAASPANGTAAAADVFGQLFPAGIKMTAAALADLEQWGRLTSRLAARGDTTGESR